MRNGKRKTITAKIAPRTGQQIVAANDPDSRDGAQGGANAGQANLQAMGLGLAAVTPEARRNFNIDEAIDGVLVTRVDPDSDAGDKGIQPGDVVLSVANKPVHTPQDVQSADRRGALRRTSNPCCCWWRPRAARASSRSISGKREFYAYRAAGIFPRRPAPAPVVAAPIPPLLSPARTH